MKFGYKILYNQRNKKDETIIVSVIKRPFSEHMASKLIRIENRELTLGCMGYNVHRMVN